MVSKLRAVKLSPSNPHSALRRPARPIPAQYGETRYLTSQQLKNPLLRSAHKRLSNLVLYRGKYLRRLDTVNGDRRTRLEKFSTFERVAEQMLVRLDLATGVLGFIDVQNGRFVLSTQRNIAIDSGVSEAVLSRLLGTLESAGYVYRRIEKVRLDEVDEAGLHLVRTRVLVRFTQQFWADLGLRYVFSRVQNSAKKRREQELKAIAQRKAAELERYSLDLHRRTISRQRWEASEKRKGQNLDASEKREIQSENAGVARSQQAGHVSDFVSSAAESNNPLAALNRLLGSAKARSSG